MKITTISKEEKEKIMSDFEEKLKRDGRVDTNIGVITVSTGESFLIDFGASSDIEEFVFEIRHHEKES